MKFFTKTEKTIIHPMYESTFELFTDEDVRYYITLRDRRPYEWPSGTGEHQIQSAIRSSRILECESKTKVNASRIISFREIYKKQYGSYKVTVVKKYFLGWHYSTRYISHETEEIQ